MEIGKDMKPDDIDAETLKLLHFIFLVASESDWNNYIEKSGMMNILDEIGINYTVIILSAHRNPDELRRFCIHAMEINLGIVFGTAAGMAAALAGAIEAIPIVKGTVVLAVALPSAEYPNAEDAVLSILQLPDTTPVSLTGISKHGLRKMALTVAQIIGREDVRIYEQYIDYLEAHKDDKKSKVLKVQINTNKS